jgi:PadR family transcriptional regulator PadR
VPQAELKLTGSVKGALNALIAQPGRDHHGTDLSDETGIPMGSIYPVLARLEALLWVESCWEEPQRREQGFPRRRYYRLSTDGLAFARSALASDRAAASHQARRLRPAGEMP